MSPHQSTFCPGFDISRLDALFADIPLRLEHMRDASRFARDFAVSFDLAQEHAPLLERSALLHDLGYAPAVRRFAFHPLDGALYLQEHGENAFVIEGVLRHSQAERKAATIPGVADEYAARLPLADADWLVRAVTIADWRAAGVGGRVSFARRFHDIALRNPNNPDKIRRAGRMVAEVRDWFLGWAPAMEKGRPLPWVFCDVDNTLIRPGDGLSTFNRSAVKAYVDAGGRFSLATGKHPRSIEPLVDELGLSTPQVAANGTCILERGEVRLLAHLGAAASDLIAGLEALALPIAIYREQGIEAGGAWEPWLDGIFDRYGEIRPARGAQDGAVLKILCVADGTDQRQEMELRSVGHALNVDCCRSDRHFLEFVPKEGNKGLAARAVLEEAGWPVLHSLALGDTENDEPLFGLCGACAAVANGTRETLLGADWIMPECWVGGVGQMLNSVRRGLGWKGLSSDFLVEE